VTLVTHFREHTWKFDDQTNRRRLHCGGTPSSNNQTAGVKIEADRSDTSFKIPLNKTTFRVKHAALHHEID
jgi:hypothetical protein